jgi:D-arabinose 1-dehydrogenase-like Zn-dependent alcohol dehydrogenase
MIGGMRAVVYEEFGREPVVREVPAPRAERDGVVIEVAATGLCRSDWHGWMGHDPDITLPHVPGHELAGIVAEAGPDVTRWRPGDRVTVPFVCACGRCAMCAAGQHQVCERQTQPGFTQWGSYAEYVAIGPADVNLVAIPADLPMATAAGLGCRFATAFHAVVERGRVRPGEWVAVYGCGGVGLSAVMIAAAAGAQVVAVDIAPAALELAARFGAVHCVSDPAAVAEVTGGGAHLSLDAAGTPATCAASINGLRPRGRHVQVGLLPGPDPALPMGRVIALELELLGSHGMAAHAYPPMLDLIARGVLRPDRLVTATIGLDEAPGALSTMHTDPPIGVVVIEPGQPSGM